MRSRFCLTIHEMPSTTSASVSAVLKHIWCCFAILLRIQRARPRQFRERPARYSSKV